MTQEGKHDHKSHHRMMILDFKKRFWVSLILTAPILALSPTIQNWMNLQFHFPGESFILFLLAVSIYFYGGWPFLTGLIKELKNKTPGMMTLIALAITVAFAYSGAVTFGLPGKTFYWELATLIDVMLVGHWIEMKSLMGASKSLEKLVQMMPNTAHRIQDNNQIEDLHVDKLQKEDKILIKPGEKIPADGVIIEGETSINESMLTGESTPVTKKKDDKIIAGSINGNSSIKAQVQKTGEESYLSQVVKMVEEGQKAKSKTQHFTDKAAFWLTVIAITVGISTLVVWLLLDYEFIFALERMVTVMVITCPHALGLAIPLVVAISTSLAAQNGLLIRNRSAFENSRKISSILFDKTGTLTIGSFEVSRVKTFSDNNEQEILKIAASIEQNSEHPIGVGIVKKAQEDNIDLYEVSNFENITGEGAKAQVNSKQYFIVGPNYLKEKNIDMPDMDLTGKDTAVYIVDDDKVVGAVVLADEIRKESYQAVKTLKENGIKVFMITGDNELVAKSVSEELNLDGYFAQVLPDKKQDKVKELQKQNEFVAMTGDGVNDAPALAEANVGIAVGSGTDIAAETADIILVNSNPQDIVNLILFGKKTYGKMVQNLIYATAYNVFAIPLAAGVLYAWGIMISPAVGAIFMSLSTIVVAINAQLLKKV
ncbi:MAG: copper-translocating P-type ATPase [Bacteriovoracia bacterium]